MRRPFVLLPLVLAACAAGRASVPPATVLPVLPPQAAAAHVESKPPPAPEPASPKPPEAFDVAAIDAWVAAQVKEQGLVGVSLAILRDGKIVLAKGYGLSSREAGTPVDESTAFAVGSVTKQFTCASVALLAEAGKLSWDDKVAKYYPELTRAKDITLADLGAHVSGYPDYYPLDFFDSRMQHAIAADDLIRKYATVPLDFEPGTRWSYSNTGYVILGRVVEKVSGEPFSKFLSEKILVPVGMAHASFAPADGTPGLARGHEAYGLAEPQAAPREPEAWMFSAGALYASATDLAKWDLALATGNVLRPASYARLTTARVLADGRSAQYGCGFSVSQQRGETVLEHGGEVNGFLASNAIVPRTRSAVVFLSNSQFGHPDAIASKILALVVEDGAKTAQPPHVNGPPAGDVVRAYFRALQAGALDRAKLGDEFALYMTVARVKAASERLRALGEPTDVSLQRTRERGGMEITTFAFSFAKEKLRVLMARSADGKIQEVLIEKE